MCPGPVTGTRNHSNCFRLIVPAQASEAFGVDVLLDGFAFRLLLYSGRDEAMLSKQAGGTATATATANTAITGSATAGAAAAGGSKAPANAAWIYSSPEAAPLFKSWHHGLVSGVAGANPSFAPAVRLAQRWLAAHMLGNHFSVEAVELLVVAAFSPRGTAASTAAPASRGTGVLPILHNCFLSKIECSEGSEKRDF